MVRRNKGRRREFWEKKGGMYLAYIDGDPSRADSVAKVTVAKIKVDWSTVVVDFETIRGGVC